MPTISPPSGVEFTVDPQPRCAHCGRFLPSESGWDLFAKHIDEECPVGGIFVRPGVLKVNGQYRSRAA